MQLYWCTVDMVPQVFIARVCSVCCCILWPPCHTHQYPAFWLCFRCTGQRSSSGRPGSAQSISRLASTPRGQGRGRSSLETSPLPVAASRSVECDRPIGKCVIISSVKSSVVQETPQKRTLPLVSNTRPSPSNSNTGTLPLVSNMPSPSNSNAGTSPSSPAPNTLDCVPALSNADTQTSAPPAAEVIHPATDRPSPTLSATSEVFVPSFMRTASEPNRSSQPAAYTPPSTLNINDSSSGVTNKNVITGDSDGGIARNDAAEQGYLVGNVSNNNGSSSDIIGGDCNSDGNSNGYSHGYGHDHSDGYSHGHSHDHSHGHRSRSSSTSSTSSTGSNSSATAANTTSGSSSTKTALTPGAVHAELFIPQKHVAGTSATKRKVHSLSIVECVRVCVFACVCFVCRCVYGGGGGAELCQVLNGASGRFRCRFSSVSSNVGSRDLQLTRVNCR